MPDFHRRHNVWSRVYEEFLTGGIRRRWSAAMGAVGAALLLAGLIGADPAHAGTYVMRNCDVPGRGNSLIGPWRTTSEMAPNAVMVDACGNGGGLGFTFTGARQMAPGSWVTLALAKPTQGPQSAIKFVKAALWYAARLSGSGQPINLSTLVFHSDGSFLPGASNGPPGAETLMLEQPFNPSQTNLYKVGIICGPPAGPPAADECFPAEGVPLQIRGMEVTLSEDIQPSVSQPGGTLLDDGRQSGLRTVTYSASDLQSGLLRVDALLDDTVVGSRDLAPRCFYYDFTVCPVSDAGTLQIDTRSVPNGSHRLTLRATDAAGNERLVNHASPVEIANEAELAPTSISPKSLIARFKGSSRRTITVAYGQVVSLEGRLAEGSQPSSGARIEIFERSARRGAREVAAGEVTTGADGSFSYALKRHRPSRTVRLTHRTAGSSEVRSQVLKLRVRAASSLHAWLRGRVIRFSGRVQSRPIPRGGKLVQMEGRAPGSAWASFANLRTDRRGRFTGSFRLRVRRPGVRLKIRAFIPAENEYPYLSFRTPAVTLRVH
jgi:hypothetical protein